MALDPSYVGRTYPPSEPYLVSREKIAEFAAAMSDRNPAYRSVSAAQALGHADVVAPPTFPVVVTRVAAEQVMFDPDLGLDYSRVVHGEQSFSYDRPLLAGDVIVVVARVDNIRSVAGNDLLNLAYVVQTTTGEPVCTVRATIVARGMAEAEASA